MIKKLHLLCFFSVFKHFNLGKKKKSAEDHNSNNYFFSDLQQMFSFEEFYPGELDMCSILVVLARNVFRCKLFFETNSARAARRLQIENEINGAKFQLILFNKFNKSWDIRKNIRISTAGCKGEKFLPFSLINKESGF